MLAKTNFTGTIIRELSIMNQTIQIIFAVILIALSFIYPADADAEQKLSFQGVSYNNDIKPEQFNFSDVIIKVKSFTKRITFSAKFKDISTPYIASNQQNSFNINIDADPQTGVIYAFRLAADAFAQTIPDHFSYAAKPNNFLIAPMSIQDGKFTSLYNQLTDHDKTMLKGACQYFKNDNNIQTLLSVKAPTGNSILGQGTNKISELLSKPNIPQQIKRIATLCFDATNGTSIADTSSFTKYKLCNFVRCVDQYSFEKPSFNGAVKPKQFQFSDVMIKARSNTDRVNIKVIFKDVSTPYKALDKEETVDITIEGDPTSETVYALRLSYGTFSQTIPSTYSYEGKSSHFLISPKSIQDGKFNSLYEQLTAHDKTKLKGVCNYFLDDKNIEEIISLKPPSGTNVIGKGFGSGVTGKEIGSGKGATRISKLLSNPNAPKQIKTLAKLCTEATERVYVKDVQTFLNASGYDVGKSDGQWGKKSQSGWESYLISQGKPLDTTFSSEAIQALQDNLTGKMPKLRKIMFQDGYFDLNGELRKHPKHAQIFDTSIKPSEIPRSSLDKTNVTLFGDSGTTEIPDGMRGQPNDETLAYYYLANDRLRFRKNESYRIMPSRTPSQFTKALEQHKIIDKQMAKKTAFSYLYYEDGNVVYDALPPKDRFKMELDNSSYFSSHSMGKSITSYLIGHAICQGYIESIDQPIIDWPLMESTLYFGQPLINLLNMKAGDTHIIKKYDGRFIKTNRNIHGNAPLLKAVKNPLELKDTVAKRNAGYAYSNLTTDVLFSYLMHRTGNNFDAFISDIYKNKIRIGYPVYIEFNPLINRDETPSTKKRIEQGAGRYGIMATRYDYLRIAKAMMDDWQNETCEGKYLKEIYKRRVSKNRSHERWDSSDRKWGKANFGGLSTRYGGQFHTDVIGLWNRNILVLNGANGQQIVIDMDNSRIVVINAGKSNNYDSYKLGFEPIKFGRIR